MPIALPAVVVIWASYVVLSSCVIARKVEAAVVADPVKVRILYMLLEGTIVRKPSFTAFTVARGYGSRKRRGVLELPPRWEAYFEWRATH